MWKIVSIIEIPMANGDFVLTKLSELVLDLNLTNLTQFW